LAARIAHLFMSEVVSRCDIGIDLHTGSDNRINLPQLRSNLDDEETRKLCETFGVPFMLHSKIRDGSLREAAGNLGKKYLYMKGAKQTVMTKNQLIMLLMES
jgi:predicted deacylase